MSNQEQFDGQSDQRIFERFPADLRATVINLNDNNRIEAKLCDLSLKGVCLLSDVSLSVNDTLDLWIESLRNGNPVYTRGTVIWTGRQKNGKYKTGIGLNRVEFMKMSAIFKTRRL